LTGPWPRSWWRGGSGRTAPAGTATAHPRAAVMAERDGLRVAAERTLRGLEPMAERVVQAALDQVAEEYAAHLTASGRVLVAQGEPVEEADLQLVAALWWAQIPSVLAPLVAVYGAGAGAMLRWLAEHRIEDDQVPDRDHPEPPDD